MLLSFVTYSIDLTADCQLTDRWVDESSARGPLALHFFFLLQFSPLQFFQLLYRRKINYLLLLLVLCFGRRLSASWRVKCGLLARVARDSKQIGRGPRAGSRNFPSPGGIMGNQAFNHQNTTWRKGRSVGKIREVGKNACWWDSAVLPCSRLRDGTLPSPGQLHNIKWTG